MDLLQSAKRECCKHGIRCFRKNNVVHRSELSHPGDDDYRMPIYEKPAKDLPVCRYGDKCVRRNPLHFQEFYHPDVAAVQTRAQSPVQEPKVSDSSSTPIRQNSLKSNELEHLDSLVTPIKQLLPGTQPYIRARIIIKSDKHPFTNEKGDGIMSTLDLIDDSGEIRLSAFGTCVHQLYDCVEVDNIYYFYNVRVSRSTCKPGVIQTNQYTLTCTETTKVLLDSRDDLPHLSFNFEPLSAVDTKEKHDVMDVIGICRSIGPVEDVTLKNLEQGKKRELKLIDQSDKEMMVIIWGTNAENFEGIYTPGCVIAFKRARVTIYAGKSLDSSCLSSSTFKMNPNIAEANELRCWYSSKDEQSEQ